MKALKNKAFRACPATRYSSEKSADYQPYVDRLLEVYQKDAVRRLAYGINN